MDLLLKVLLLLKALLLLRALLLLQEVPYPVDPHLQVSLSPTHGLLHQDKCSLAKVLLANPDVSRLTRSHLFFRLSGYPFPYLWLTVMIFCEGLERLYLLSALSSYVFRWPSFVSLVKWFVCKYFPCTNKSCVYSFVVAPQVGMRFFLALCGPVLSFDEFLENIHGHR
jgi:hypothetical protein